MKGYCPTVNTGDQDDTLIGRNVEEFQNNPTSMLFLGTHGKCGTGWTLNAASYAIFLDTPWTDASLSQSTDRLWRVTNTRPAIIRILVCEDSIDERVREIVDTKKDLADYVIDGKENELSISLQNEMRRILREL
jgi:SNF2 family DNA or RNA helicase